MNLNPVRLDHKKLLSHYASGDYSGAVDLITAFLKAFQVARIGSVSADTARVFDRVVESIGYLLTREDFYLDEPQNLKLLRYHPALINVAALSNYNSFDSFLKHKSHALNQRPALWPLVGTRGTVYLSLPDALVTSRRLASEWYGHYFFGVRSFPTERIIENLRNHMEAWSADLLLISIVSNGYMRSTYIDPHYDRVWKRRFNDLVKRNLTCRPLLASKHQRKRIAVLTARWAKQHPTYKNRYSLFKLLAESYDLTLVHLGHDRQDLELDIFTKKIRVGLEGKGLDPSPILAEQFDLAFYPDIGMNVESRFLSNLRLAPVQITTNSHPVSTFGSEIDYFITGSESEAAPAEAATYYSERLILIPGIGTQPIRQQYRPELLKNMQQRLDLNADRVRIACPWGCLKINADLLGTLRKLKDKFRQKLTFVFLVTLGQDNNSVEVLRKDLNEILGDDHVELHADQPYENYLSIYSTCLLALDAYPFGGNTSIIDALIVRIPIITRIGWQFYNKAGAVILQKAGLPELAVRTEHEQIEKALALLSLPEQYRSVLERLERLNVDQLLPTLSDANAFKKAIDLILSGKVDPQIKDPLVL